MKLLSTTLTAIAMTAILTTNAFAINLCESRVNDIPDILVPGATGNKIVGSSTGKDGWDGIGGKCTKPGSSAVWAGPRNANGVCLTPASLVGTVAAPLYKPFKDPDTTIVTPDDPEYRIGFYFNPPGPPPTVWIGTNWIDGTCP